ncbi:MAG: class I SAM-dependent methyltransferase [Bryobacteraceae bacterium]
MMNPAEFANIARSEEDFWWYQGMRSILFRLLDRHVRGRHPKRVLEAGCGTGHFARVAAERYGWRIYPTDLGWEGLCHGRGMGLQKLSQSDIAALPFVSEAFDVVISLDVIVHFPRGEEERPMREMARVLAPGGLLALRVSALDVLRSRHSQFAFERQRFTRARLKNLAQRCGIRVLRCSYANSLLMPVALAKFRIWEPLLRKPPASGVEPVASWMNRVLRIPLTIESAVLGSGIDFPAGQSLILIGEKA